jgi:hypothetical protein
MNKKLYYKPVNVKLTERQYKYVEDKAIADQTTLADTIRRIINDEQAEAQKGK